MADETKSLQDQIAAKAKLLSLAGELRTVQDATAYIESEKLKVAEAHLAEVLKIRDAGKAGIQDLTDAVTLEQGKFDKLKAQVGVSAELLALAQKNVDVAMKARDTGQEMLGMGDDQIAKLGEQKDAQKEISDEADRTQAILEGAQGSISNTLTMMTGISDSWKNTGIGAFFVTAKATDFGTALSKVAKAGAELFTVSNILGSAMIGIGAAIIKMAIASAQAEAEFRKAQGTGDEWNSTIRSGAVEAARFGVTVEAFSKGMNTLRSSYANFDDTQKEVMKGVAIHATMLERLGISVEATSKRLAFQEDIMGMNKEQAKEMDAQLIAVAGNLSMGLGPVMDNFNSIQEEMSVHGADAGKEFIKLQTQSKKLGIDIKSLTSVMKGYDTISGAVAKTAKLNVLLGGQFLNASRMRNATEAERVIMLKRAYDASGKNIQQMHITEKRQLAAAAGFQNVGEAIKLLTKAGTADLEALGNANASLAGDMKEVEIRAEGVGSPMERLMALMGKLVTVAGPIVDALSAMVGWFISLSESISIWGALGLLAGGLVLVGIALRGMGNAASMAGTAMKNKFIKPGGMMDKLFSKKKADDIGKTDKSTKSFATTIRELGAAAGANKAGLLTLGLVFIMIGIGVAIAAYGVAELVRSFTGFSATEILAISVALFVFGLMMVGMMVVLYFMVTSGMLPTVAAGLAGLGLALLLMGGAVWLAAMGMTQMVHGAIIPMMPYVGQFALFVLMFGLLAIAGLLMLPAGVFAMLGLGFMAIGLGALAFALLFISTDDLTALGNMMMGLGMAASGAGGGMKDAVPTIKAFMKALLGMAEKISIIAIIQPMIGMLGNAIRSVGLGAAVGAESLPQFNIGLGATFMLLEQYAPVLEFANFELTKLFNNFINLVSLTEPLSLLAMTLHQLALGIAFTAWSLKQLDPETTLIFTTMMEEVGTASEQIVKLTPESIDNVDDLIGAVRRYHWASYSWGGGTTEDSLVKVIEAVNKLRNPTGAAAGAAVAGGAAATTVVLELDGRELGRTVEALLNRRQKTTIKRGI